MRLALPLSVLAVSLGGCLFIPYREAVGNSRHTPDAKGLELLDGTPTREQVLLRLGEPDWTARRQRVFVYTWWVTRGALLIFFRPVPIDEKRHFLLMEFGEDGLIRRHETLTTSDDEVTDELESW